MRLLTFFDSADYIIGVSFFLKGLGFVYALAFFALARQVRGLYGEHGILPICQIETKLKWTLFRFGTRDSFIQILAWLGFFLSLFLLFGIFPSLALFAILLIYHAFLVAGGEFLSFQWDTLLIEVGLMAFFLSIAVPAPPTMLLGFWLFIARFMFSAGFVKIQSKDPNWRNLTAVKIHYQTQPLPNRVAWHMYQLPLPFHKFSTLAMFTIELAVPALIFFTGPPQLIAFVLIGGLQLVLIATGNFSFLNYLTLSLCFVFLPNSYWPAIATNTPAASAHGIVIDIFLNCAGAFYIVVNLAHLLRFGTRSQFIRKFLSFLSRFHISSPYGLFAVMTTTRYELSLEGSNDGVSWEAYAFRYKPEDPMKAPRQIAPFHPRLDWQMWFAALDPMYMPTWLGYFVKQLLLGSKDVLKLMANNPFSDHSPKWIRVVVYEYEFTNRDQHKKTGAYWYRHLLGVHPAQSLMRGSKEMNWY